MKTFCFLIIIVSLHSTSIAQKVAGRWYGKITQQAGGFSELYDLELNLSQRKIISGESYAYIPDILFVRIGLTGYIDGDSIRLKEALYDIRDEVMPISWIACIKNMNLKYYKQGDDEYLKGVWDGTSKEDRSPCLPGQIILSRSKQALNQFIINDGFQRPYLTETPEIAKAVAQFTPEFLNTSIKKVKEIQVKNRQIELRISDYSRVDNDTVSIYLNRDMLASRQRISKKKIRLYINLDARTDLNEIILFAENLGRIPPNTSQLLVVDGATTHKVVIESDKQKSAALYLRYKPENKEL